MGCPPSGRLFWTLEILLYINCWGRRSMITLNRLIEQPHPQRVRIGVVVEILLFSSKTFLSILFCRFCQQYQLDPPFCARLRHIPEISLNLG